MGVNEMTTRLVCRTARVAAMLAASIAFTASINAANAKSNHRDGSADGNGANQHVWSSAKPTGTKRVKHEKKQKKSVTKTKTCLYMTSDGRHCDSNSTAGKKPPPKDVTDKSPPPPKTITVSNGVTTYTLPFDPKFSVEVAQPGSITVHSGERTV